MLIAALAGRGRSHLAHPKVAEALAVLHWPEPGSTFHRPSTEPGLPVLVRSLALLVTCKAWRTLSACAWVMVPLSTRPASAFFIAACICWGPELPAVCPFSVVTDGVPLFCPRRNSWRTRRHQVRQLLQLIQSIERKDPPLALYHINISLRQFERLKMSFSQLLLSSPHRYPGSAAISGQCPAMTQLVLSSLTSCPVLFCRLHERQNSHPLA